ncbi:ComF family protein [Paraflavisolibacter sp. H34]|uniref:ComF family protein n=1 Tax=Huijunlia imazamoxiresistens TaxID=3127457 RepID=UPI00301B1478
MFPHLCAGCGSDQLSRESLICVDCLSSLPSTYFHMHGNNPVEKMFWGRLPVTCATAQYYFTKDSVVQRLLHQLKYRGNRELGTFLGRMMGQQLAQSNRFLYVDALVPLPLFPARERRRGYNQAALLCAGIAEFLQKPVLPHAVVRRTATATQTRMNRLQRWQNMENRFELVNGEGLEGKHLLLVDDVVTTGATLEACGRELLKAPEVRLSIATLCLSST